MTAQVDLETRRIAGYEAQRQFNQLGRLVKRNLKMTHARPQPPRNLRFEGNLLKWDPPADDSAVTHYRVRIDRDTGLPDFEFSSGQTAVQLFKGESFVVSSYNAPLDQESVLVGVGAGYGANGNVGLGGRRGGISFVSITAALSDPNDFGLRFWLVTCNYSTSVKGLKGVAVWVENPVNGAPERLAQSTYIPNSSNSAIVAILPPNTTRTIRVYLVGIWDLEDPLLTVADHGEDGSSAHKTIDIGPVPTEAQGVEYVANVTAPGVTVTTYKDSNGLTRTRMNCTFTAPADARWGGVQIDAKRPGPIYEQLNRGSVSPAVFPIESPSTSQSWRIFFRSYDKRGKTNSLNEGATGTPTPYVDITLGSNSGTFDAAKIQQSSLSSALYVANNVLGIQPLGIDENLIADFAISKAKLANAPIIDSLRIEDEAVGTAQIKKAAVTSALIANAAILEAHIADAAITDAKIKDLHVDKITSWSGATIDIGSQLVFSGTGGIQFFTPGGLEVQARITATAFDLITGASSGYRVGGTTVINRSSDGFFHDVGALNGGVFRVNGQQVLGPRKPAIGKHTVTIPTSGANTADSCSGDLYNSINELQQKIDKICDTFGISLGHGMTSD